MLFFAMAAAGMLASCSSEDNVESNNPNESSLQKIELGVSTVANATTRGTGTVGGVKGDGDNVWAGQDLWVYMLEKNSMKIANYKDPYGKEYPIFDNMHFYAPKADNDEEGTDSGIASTVDGSVAYYPVDGQSDFWGYRVDDACKVDNPKEKTKFYTADGQETQNVEEAVKRVVDIEIDGSQDIMAGKAELVDGDVEKLGAQPENYYSAYASRKGVQPNIKFNHLLTRFTFKVKAGSKSAAGNGDNTDPVRVTGISVNSKNQGHLTVAYTGEKPESLLTFDGTYKDAVPFKLMERKSDNHNDTLKDLDPTALTWNVEEDKADVLPIGEALLVAPGEKAYTLTIDLKQNVLKQLGAEKEEMQLQQTSTLKLKNPDMEFEAGKSYEVTITVYGLEKIEVTATLQPWDKGDSIDIDEDNLPE